MPAVGPELPPHLAAKRKRQEEDFEVRHSPPRKRSVSSSSDGAEKRRKVIGPSLPPANLDERPPSDPKSASNSDSEEDLGPALPPPPGSARSLESHPNQGSTDESLEAVSRKTTHRDEWMLLPPKKDDLSSRADPTKLRNRKFNTGKGAKAPSTTGPNDNALWTETVEQKKQRLEDEIMGVRKPAQLDQDAAKSKKSEAEAKETERKVREYNEKNNRNSSLYSEHKKTTPKEKEDDPSKRAFDKEKDMGVGVKIGHAQRKELLNKAADFGSRFAGGNYL